MSKEELDVIWNRNAVVPQSVEQCLHNMITSKTMQAINFSGADKSKIGSSFV